jgi:hypothetical protein
MRLFHAFLGLTQATNISITLPSNGTSKFDGPVPACLLVCLS